MLNSIRGFNAIAKSSLLRMQPEDIVKLYKTRKLKPKPDSFRRGREHLYIMTLLFWIIGNIWASQYVCSMTPVALLLTWINFNPSIIKYGMNLLIHS